ncbi:winged helix-turn-helix domain-containing protein [Streptomyces sp. E11-3]|uniref:ArsR/SmtB family transcription factor n=1 Tax=Streptomyces sp. E11-3 TaxID=3110112 RepID=UPI00397FAABC
MLRIHFTGQDLARLRLAQQPDPLWETVLSFHRLRDRRGRVAFDAWRAHTRSRLRCRVRMLNALVPVRGYFPDFITPLQGQRGWQDGTEAIRSTPRQRLLDELRLVDAEQRLPSWGRPLAEGSLELLDRLVTTLHDYHRVAVAPHWRHIRAHIDADRALRTRSLLNGGAEGLLDGLRPVLRWSSPVLEASYPTDREVHLGGRGLLLVPSFFCWRYPVTLFDDLLRPVLVYPVRHLPAAPRRADGLGRLLGRTRAEVLRCIDGGCTTGELARRAGISPASASEHAGALREGGLTLTQRQGGSVLHTLTPLGGALLEDGTAHRGAGLMATPRSSARWPPPVPSPPRS